MWLRYNREHHFVDHHEFIMGLGEGNVIKLNLKPQFISYLT